MFKILCDQLALSFGSVEYFMDAFSEREKIEYSVNI